MSWNTLSREASSSVGRKARRSSRNARVWSAEIRPFLSPTSNELRTSEHQKAGTRAWAPAFSKSSTPKAEGVYSSGKHQDRVTEASRTIQLTDAPRLGAA